MHKGPREAASFMEGFLNLHPPARGAIVVIFPPSISLVAARHAALARTDIEFGVQNVHTEESGAHTGAVSAPMAADAGATWGLAGHSERRHEFGDTDEMIGRRLAMLADSGLRPVLCVGETLEERENGQLESTIRRQVEAALGQVPQSRQESVLYAYEPVWAIGTGLAASETDASEAHGIVRDAVRGTLRSGGAPSGSAGSATGDEHITVLYGGSAVPSNASDLLAAPGIDGLLVGGASLEPESWAAICAARG